jgi:uncharacterized protein (DUF1330 family)
MPKRRSITCGVIDLSLRAAKDGPTAREQESVMTDTPAGSGKGYIYVEMTIHDPERFKQYTALSAPAVQAAGGWYPVAGVKPEVLEGSFAADRIVLVEFDSLERARAFYRSAAYQAAKLRRTGAADFKMLLLPGAARRER